MKTPKPKNAGAATRHQCLIHGQMCSHGPLSVEDWAKIYARGEAGVPALGALKEALKKKEVR